VQNALVTRRDGGAKREEKSTLKDGCAALAGPQVGGRLLQLPNHRDVGDGLPRDVPSHDVNNTDAQWIELVRCVRRQDADVQSVKNEAASSQ